jgi:formylglycine-generating enzyme required for sulfatase activity
MTAARAPYDLRTIRRLLLAAFDSRSLRRLCYYEPQLRPIVDEFAPAHGLSDRVDVVIEYCQRQVLLEVLLAAVQAANPAQYARFFPQQVPPTPRPAARPSFEPATVPVPAGPFLMGSRRASDQQAYETPQHTVTLPAFRMGRYPVTKAQYAAFVEAMAYAPPADWVDGQFPPEQGDHPVVYVSWHDAQAYLAWLWQQTGRPYRLPSEAEWEKAARGEDGRLWPWGNAWDPARANCKPAGPGGTTPVGEYSPAGDSPYDCSDMAGNVLEWTNTLFGRDWEVPQFGYPYDPADGRETLTAGDEVFRLQRGGSFISHMRFVRCSCRYWSLPHGKDWYCGFRVALGGGLPDA